MKEFILPILKNPNNNNALLLKVEENYLIDSEFEIFSIEKDVPVLLPRTVSHYQEHYEKDSLTFDYFDDFDSVYVAENKRLHQNILHFLPHNGITLDVGCGNAWLAKAISFGKSKVISMDISHRNPKIAMKTVLNDNHQAIVADAINLPFFDNSIDYIVASEIIEHVEDPKLFIHKLLEVLKPKGILIITTPYNEKILKSLCIHCNKLTPHDAHLHSFNRKKILSLLPADLEKVETKIFNNKFLIKTKLILLLDFLPFPIWNFIDQICNSLFPKHAKRLLIKITK
ncbi:class I SAM-dependent methyltransferase [Halpernia sp.]|uniref:class I SAM-dependent methyltransferase n=1 Tax=Halpernia sp. TaxID=2782209 RepID=UPI003A932BA9